MGIWPAYPPSMDQPIRPCDGAHRSGDRRRNLRGGRMRNRRRGRRDRLDTRWLGFLHCRYLRERKLEARSRAHLALDFDVPSVLAHDSVADKKPEPRALSRALGCEERIENAREIFRSD